MLSEEFFSAVGVRASPTKVVGATSSVLFFVVVYSAGQACHRFDRYGRQLGVGSLSVVGI